MKSSHPETGKEGKHSPEKRTATALPSLTPHQRPSPARVQKDAPSGAGGAVKRASAGQDPAAEKKHGHAEDKTDKGGPRAGTPDGSIAFVYNENTGDYEPLECFRPDELLEFHDRLKEYLEAGGEQ